MDIVWLLGFIALTSWGLYRALRFILSPAFLDLVAPGPRIPPPRSPEDDQD